MALRRALVIYKCLRFARQTSTRKTTKIKKTVSAKKGNGTKRGLHAGLKQTLFFYCPRFLHFCNVA